MTEDIIFTPVTAPSTYAETVGRLGTAIRIGVLAPGERLPPERELADQLEISRSTLRQALGSLTESKHLVAIRGRRGGTFVAQAPPVASDVPFDPLRSRALIDWRTALELGTVQLAAERATGEQREALADTATDVENPADWPAFRREDARFHLAIAAAASCAPITAAMTRIQGELSDMLVHFDRRDLDPAESAEQHRAVAGAVAAGDAAAAREAMRTHLAAIERCLATAVTGNGANGSR